MSLTIWKYPLPSKARFTLKLPYGAEVLTVQMQHGIACLWAKVNPENTERNVSFLLVGTGTDAPIVAKYIGLIQLDDGDFVFHLFQEGYTS